MTIDQINEDIVKEKMNKEKEKLFDETIKKCMGHIGTLLLALNKTIMEFKELYRDICKTHVLTIDIDKEISKVQKEIDNIADNLIGSSKPLSVTEQKIHSLEEKLEKFENEKDKIKGKAKDLKCKTQPQIGVPHLFE